MDYELLIPYFNCIPEYDPMDGLDKKGVLQIYLVSGMIEKYNKLEEEVNRLKVVTDKITEIESTMANIENNLTHPSVDTKTNVHVLFSELHRLSQNFSNPETLTKKFKEYIKDHTFGLDHVYTCCGKSRTLIEYADTENLNFTIFPNVQLISDTLKDIHNNPETQPLLSKIPKLPSIKSTASDSSTLTENIYHLINSPVESKPESIKILKPYKVFKSSKLAPPKIKKALSGKKLLSKVYVNPIHKSIVKDIKKVDIDTDSDDDLTVEDVMIDYNDKGDPFDDIELELPDSKNNKM